MRQPPGTVFLVGAGPGAPDLITVRGVRILGQADIVFHDALVHPDTLALAPRAVKVAVGKRCGRRATAQQFINKRLVDAARKYRIVVRVKGGDPMLFGRAHEEIAALAAAGVPCEVVPGVTSALAAAAEAGTSLTQRGVARSVAFVTARVGEDQPPSAWAQQASAADTSVIYMGAGQAAAVRAGLVAAGTPCDTPVLVVENATLPESRRIALTLGQLDKVADLGLIGPTLIMVGRVFAPALCEPAASEAQAQAARRTA